MAAEQHPEVLSLPLVWVGVDEVPIVMANQVLGQIAGEDEVVLAFGQVTPPPFLGTPEQRIEQAKQIQYVAVRVVARLSLTHTRLQELVRVLQQTLDNYDQAVKILKEASQ